MKDMTMDAGEDDRYRHADPDMDAALDWFLRLKDEGSDQKNLIEAFQHWLQQSPAHGAAFQEVEAVWADPEILAATGEMQNAVCSGNDFGRPALAQAIVPLALPPGAPAQTGKNRFQFRQIVKNWQAMAASFIVLAGLAQFAPAFILEWRADYHTQVGERAEIRLPDGSRMILNGKSAVALDFNAGKRGVRLLQGEAWFDVVHDPAHPFHVTGRYSDTWVLGTRFDVKLEPGNDVIALQSGSVKAVHHDASLPMRELQPGQMVRAASHAMSGISNFDGDETLGWLDGRYVFSNMTLGDVLRNVQENMPERVIVLNRALLNVAISGNFRLEHPARLIDGLAAAAGGKTTRLPGSIVIIH